MLAVLHAYSRRNPGDGLLLDLAFRHLEGAGIDPRDCVVFALDAPSFPDLPDVRQIGVAGSGPSFGLIPAGAKLGAAGLSYLSGGRWRVGEAAEVLASASGIIGIAGGYLRAGGFVTSFGSLINHIPQLGLAAQTSLPSVYLPQSIGPLRGGVGRLIRSLLARIDLVCCRDDSSIEELGPRVNTRRFPDLAVMHVAEAIEEPVADGGDRVVIVARDLGRQGRYVGALRNLSVRFPDAIWAVQSRGEGRKHDGDFVGRLGLEPAGPLEEVLRINDSGVVVAVRLHGALQALISGWPAIHLSYQRKGWGAYADLGLPRYVHDARSFDPRVVSAQVEELLRDPEPYWRSVLRSAPRLREASAFLTEELRTRFAPVSA